MTRVADISVLIVAYRSRATIGACLEALARQTVQPREVFLLENGSPAGEAVRPDEVPDGIRFVTSSKNLGFAGGNNRLAREASGRWIACLNPDAYARPDWIEALEAATTRHAGTVLFGSTQLVADDPERIDGAGDVYHVAGLAYRGGYGQPVDRLPEEGRVFAPCAAASLVRRDVFEALGGFDTDFFCYNEDVDLAYRARLLGHHVVQLRSAVVEHAGYASSGRRSEFATYHGIRNRLWVVLTNTPGWLTIIVWPLHAALIPVFLVQYALMGLGPTYLRAVRDAVAAWPHLMRKRRAVQAGRRVKPSAIAAAMTWNPSGLIRRTPDVRPDDRTAASTRPVRER